MSRLCVGIICGGCSLEYEVSLQSAIYIARSIDKLVFDVKILWIDKEGCWHLKKDISSDFFSCQSNEYINVFLKKQSCQFIVHNKNITYFLKFDVIFPIMHGFLGEDGALQGMLRIMNLPFVGSGVLGSAIGMDKDISKRLLSVSGLSVVPFRTFFISDWSHINFESLTSELGLPLFVKPVDQGSSIGISKIFSYRDFCCALDIAFSVSNKILIESAIVARELECAILGNYDNDNLDVSVCGEIILKNNDFYTYQDKYTEHDSFIQIPALLDDITRDRVRLIALQVFKTLNCLGMARVSMFLDLNDNHIFVNEINTLPGFNADSLYVKLWEHTNLNVQTLISKLLKLALDTYDNKNHRKNIFDNNIQDYI